MKNGRRWIDVREYREYASGYIEGSELVPLGQLGVACEDWDRKQPLTVVCRSGARATRACAQLRARGFKDVAVLPGGVMQWRASGKAVKAMERRPANGAGGGGLLARLLQGIAGLLGRRLG